MKYFLFLAFFSSLFNLSAQIKINEYSCSNIAGPTDAYGEREDWIELYNTTATTIDLTGWYLSDKASNLTKWLIQVDQLMPMDLKWLIVQKEILLMGHNIIQTLVFLRQREIGLFYQILLEMW